MNINILQHMSICELPFQTLSQYANNHLRKRIECYKIKTQHKKNITSPYCSCAVIQASWRFCTNLTQNKKVKTVVLAKIFAVASIQKPRSANSDTAAFVSMLPEAAANRLPQSETQRCLRKVLWENLCNELRSCSYFARNMRTAPASFFPSWKQLLR